MKDLITTSLSHNLLHIQFNRASKMNAIDLQMYMELNKAFELASESSDIHAILISSTSDHFTSGNDLNDFMQVASDIQNSPTVEFIHKLANFKKPLIAAVKGNAIGIGTTLLLHCDLVYAAPNARFSTPFTKLALVPEAGASYLLPKLIGNAKAAKMLLLGESLTAHEAEQAGLVTEIYQNDDFDDYVLSKAINVAKLPQNSVLETKALMKRDATTLTACMEAEVERFAHLLQQPEFRSVAAAFLAKK